MMIQKTPDTRLNITIYDIYGHMRNKGWLSITQMASIVGRLVPPENAVRSFLCSPAYRDKTGNTSSQPMSVQIAIGLRYIVYRKMYLTKSGRVATKVVDGVRYYMITKKGIEAYEKHKARKAPPGRKNSIPCKG